MMLSILLPGTSHRSVFKVWKIQEEFLTYGTISKLLTSANNSAAEPGSYMILPRDIGEDDLIRAFQSRQDSRAASSSSKRQRNRTLLAVVGLMY